LQVVLSVVTFWPRSAATSAGEPVFPDLEAGDIVALSITDNEGQEITLRKVEDGWVMPEADNFPANETAITPLLEKIASLNTETLVTRTDASHKQLQVAEGDFLRRLTVETAGGETHTIYLGSAPRYTATHFRISGQSETYLTTKLSTWEFNARANSWIETTYTSIDQETLTTVTLENANGTFVLVREGEDWTLADRAGDEEVSAGKTNALVRNASNLTVQTPLGKSEEPAYGFDTPLAVVTLETASGETHVIQVGAEGPEGTSYTVKYSGSPFYVRVAAFNVSAMVENTREDFLVVPATPTVEP
jgi:hypothetical protein